MSTDKEKRPKTEKNAKSLKVATFCIVALVIFYFGCNFLKGLNAFSRKTYYYAVFDNIGGLHESATVTLNGYPVGKVNNISLLSSNPTRICAEFLITEDIDLPADSHFEVIQTDVLGSTSVNLIIGQSEKKAQNKDTLACNLAGGIFDGIDELKEQLTNVIASIDTIGRSLKSAFSLDDPHNGGLMLKNTLVNLEASTRHLNQILAANENKFDNIVSKLDCLSTTLNNATPQINSVINNIDKISDSLAQSNIRTLLNDAQATVSNVNNIAGRIERGEGSAGMLLSNDSLYNNLNSTIESLNALLTDIKTNPKKYINVTVFGKKKE